MTQVQKEQDPNETVYIHAITGPIHCAVDRGMIWRLIECLDIAIELNDQSLHEEHSDEDRSMVEGDTSYLNQIKKLLTEV